MVDKKISALTMAGGLDASELLPLVQAGATRRAALSACGAWIAGSQGLARMHVSANDPGPADDATQGHAAGSGWVNGASGVRWTCADATAGAARWIAEGAMDHPGYVSGRTYPVPSSGRNNSATSADTLYAVRMPIARRTTIGALCAYVVSASAGNVRFGLYANAGGNPGTKIAEGVAAPSTGSTGGIAVALPSDLAIDPGAYWLVSLFSGTPGMASIANNDHLVTALVGGASVANALTPSNAVTGIGGSATFAGGLPATFGPAAPRFGSPTPLMGFTIA